jgi:hypothetical protein
MNHPQLVPNHADSASGEICGFFDGRPQDGACKRCGGTWQQHYGPERPPATRLPEHHEVYAGPNLTRQAACEHAKLTPTQVGGFTCDDCGLYLFRRPTETG